MNIIGLDLSLCNSGWVVLTDKGKIIDSGVIKSKKKGVERLIEIEEAIWKNALYGRSIQVAVIEGYAYGVRSGRSFSIGELGGNIKTLIFMEQMNYYVVAPTSLKKFITGKGRCDKNELMKEVYKKWGVDIKTEHENDAYGLARIGKEIINPSKRVLKYEQEVIKKVLKDEGKNNYIKGV